MRISVYCLTFCFELKNLKIHKTKAVTNIYIQEKIIIRWIFNLGLALTRFQTARLWLQQVNKTWARDPIKNQYLASLKK